MSQSRNPLVPLRVFLPYLLEQEMNKKGATSTFHSVFFSSSTKPTEFYIKSFNSFIYWHMSDCIKEDNDGTLIVPYLQMSLLLNFVTVLFFCIKVVHGGSYTLNLF